MRLAPPFAPARSALTRSLLVASTVVGCLLALPASATGLATCDSGPREGWQPVAKLEKMLTDKGWKVRRIKEDGGCYEVYALNEKDERVEAYFHPVTFASVATKKR